MTTSDLTRIAYFLADRFGNGEVDNQQIVDFLISVTGQQGLDTQDLSNGIQRELRDNGEIESVKHGSGGGGPGVFRILGPGRDRARTLLAQLVN
ncbi:MAG: hypothetical protein OXF50_20525 [Caldilineaceae bacterium]|nr:hypothetical protein [Caldilineaceae bacterium]